MSIETNGMYIFVLKYNRLHQKKLCMNPNVLYCFLPLFINPTPTELAMIIVYFKNSCKVKSRPLYNFSIDVFLTSLLKFYGAE